MMTRVVEHTNIANGTKRAIEEKKKNNSGVLVATILHVGLTEI